MKYLLFLIWLLGIGAQGQTCILNRNSPRYCFKSFILRQHDTCATIGNGGCEITGPLNQPINQAAQKAADETDGKPPSKLNCTMDAFTHKISPPECADDDRMDVPAVQHKNKEIVANCYIVNNLDEDTSGKPPCTREVETYTCKDKSRVLLRSEDGRAHCIKFPE